jgi:hypothetical protein
MTITLVKKEECIGRTNKRLHANTDNKSDIIIHTIELVKEEDCISTETKKVHDPNEDIGWALKPSPLFIPTVKRKIEKEVQVVRTKKEKPWITRRNNCKYYNIETSACAIDKKRQCFNCKKKCLEKSVGRYGGWLKKFEYVNRGR